MLLSHVKAHIPAESEPTLEGSGHSPVWGCVCGWCVGGWVGGGGGAV